MSTKKHHAFVSSRKGSQRSQDVPGIGSVYAGRLAKHNITSASQLTDLYHQTSSKAEFLREYQSMTGANSRYSGMTYEGIRQQAAMSDYGRESYSYSTPDYSYSAPFNFGTTRQPTYSTSNQTIRNPVSSPLLTTAFQDQSSQAAKTTISTTEVKLNPIKKPVVYGLDPIDFLLAHTSTPETYQNEKSGISYVIIKEDSPTTSAIQPIPTQVKLDQTKKINAFGSTTNSVGFTLVQTSTTSTSSQDTSDQKGNISMFTNAISSDFPKTSVNQDVDQIKKEVGIGTQNGFPASFKQTTFNQNKKPTITSGNSQNTSTKQPAAKEDVSDQSKKKVGSGTQNATLIPSPKDTFKQDEKPIIPCGDSQNTSTKQPAAKQDVLNEIKKKLGIGTQNGSPTTFKQTSFNQNEKPTITSGDSLKTTAKLPAAKQDMLDQIKKGVGSGTQNATPIPSPKDTFKQDEKPTIPCGDSQNIYTKHPAAKQDALDQIKKEVENGTQNATLIPSPKETFNQDEKPTITSGDSQKTTAKQPAAKQDVLNEIKKKLGIGTQNSSPTTFKQTSFNQNKKPTITSGDSLKSTVKQPAAKQDMLDKIKKGVGSGTQNATPIPSPKDTFKQDEKPTITSGDSQKTTANHPTIAKQDVLDQIKKEVGSGTQNRPQPLFKYTYNLDVKPTISSVEYNAYSPKIWASETHAFKDVTKASNPYICGRCLNDQKRGELLDLRIATAKADQIANEKLNKLKIRALELEIENKELDLQIKKKSLST